jgi:predicted kinase
MNTFHIMIGIAGSGKSTYASTIPNAINVSSDEVRLELFGDLLHQDQSNHMRVFNIVNSRLNELMSANKSDIVYDATNLNIRRRADVYKRASKAGYKVKAHMFFMDMLTSNQVNNLRETSKQVPLVVRSKQFMGLTPPLLNVDCDEIEYHGQKWFEREIDFSDNTDCLEAVIDAAIPIIKSLLELNYDEHDSKYHLESIDEHINNVYNDCPTLYAAFHDLGKGFCKDGGRFIDHENVSSQLLANYGWSVGLNVDADTKLVRFHMLPFNGMSDKVKRRYNLSNDEIDALQKFNKIDRANSKQA